MIRKTVLLAGVTAALLTAAPALAQDATTPPAAAESQGSLQLQPGANVKGSDGAVLGALEGVQNTAAGEQQLTVRGADGALRGVPLGGLRQDGADVVVGISSAEFQTAPVVDDAAPATTDDAAPSAGEPSTPPLPTEPETTDPTAEPQA